MISRALLSRTLARRCTLVTTTTARSSSTLASPSFNTSHVTAVTSFPVRQFSEAPPAFLDAKEVTDRILEVVKNFDQVDAAKVTPEASFTEELGLDSLDAVEVVMAIEDEFAVEIPDQEADKIATIADAVNYISSHPMAK